jgi:hypothetical protein
MTSGSVLAQDIKNFDGETVFTLNFFNPGDFTVINAGQPVVINIGTINDNNATGSTEPYMRGKGFLGYEGQSPVKKSLKFSLVPLPLLLTKTEF